MDDTDPLVTVMKVEKAPQETYADIGGLDNQIQEIKVFKRGVLHHRLGCETGWVTVAGCLYRNRWSCLSHIRSITKRWELSLQKASSCTGPLAQVRALNL